MTLWYVVCIDQEKHSSRLDSLWEDNELAYRRASLQNKASKESNTKYVFGSVAVWDKPEDLKRGFHAELWEQVTKDNNGS